jgi:hypothetical protein
MLNKPDNTLMVHASVEKAMDRGEIAFPPTGNVQEGEVTEFKIVIIDPSILERPGLFPWKVSADSFTNYLLVIDAFLEGSTI